MNWAPGLEVLRRNWAWATSPAGGVVLTILAVLGAVGASYSHGYHRGVATELARWEAKMAEDAKTIDRLSKEAAKSSAALRAAHESRDDQIVTRTRTLIQKVPIYVTPEDDARCPVPNAAVSLLNAAVSGDPVLPPAAIGPDQAASAVPLSAVVGFGIENTGIGQQWRDEALTWRAWYVDQAKTWAKP